MGKLWITLKKIEIKLIFENKIYQPFVGEIGYLQNSLHITLV